MMFLYLYWDAQDAKGKSNTGENGPGEKVARGLVFSEMQSRCIV